MASTLVNEPVEVAEPLIVPLYLNPLVKLPLILEASCAELDIVLAIAILVSSVPSPANVIASIRANEPVELAEPLIVPSNSKPLVKAPLIYVAI